MTNCARCKRDDLPVAPGCYQSPTAHVDPDGDPCSEGHPSGRPRDLYTHYSERQLENLDELLRSLESA